MDEVPSSLAKLGTNFVMFVNQYHSQLPPALFGAHGQVQRWLRFLKLRIKSPQKILSGTSKRIRVAIIRKKALSSILTKQAVRLN